MTMNTTVKDQVFYSATTALNLSRHISILSNQTENKPNGLYTRKNMFLWYIDQSGHLRTKDEIRNVELKSKIKNIYFLKGSSNVARFKSIQSNTTAESQRALQVMLTWTLQATRIVECYLGKYAIFYYSYPAISFSGNKCDYLHMKNQIFTILVANLEC